MFIAGTQLKKFLEVVDFGGSEFGRILVHFYTILTFGGSESTVHPNMSMS